ncbi:MAG: hypothetical protein ACJAWW_001003 [Sulfurimonas sp.]|jgi:hypothetical protein
MKSILLMLMLATILLSSEKQIIVGSFLEEKNALNALVKVESLTQTDDKLSKLVKINSIEVELKTIGKYYAISLSPLTSYVQLLRTLRALEKYYDDAYVLDNGIKIQMAEVIDKVAEEEVSNKVIQEVSLPVIKTVQKPKKIEKVYAYNEVKTTQQDADKKNYDMELLLALLVFIGLLIIIFIISKRKKKDIDILK